MRLECVDVKIYNYIDLKRPKGMKRQQIEENLYDRYERENR
jgi:hypothetical protein